MTSSDLNIWNTFLISPRISCQPTSLLLTTDPPQRHILSNSIEPFVKRSINLWICSVGVIQDDRMFSSNSFGHENYKRSLIYRKWRKAQGINCLKYWLLHQETKAKLRRMIHQRRRETCKDFCNKMEKGEYTKAIARLCKIRKNRNLKPSFSTIDGPE